jgi:splicing factor 3A subunit 1
LNFSLIETIEFYDDEDENLPRPMALNEVISVTNTLPYRDTTLYKVPEYEMTTEPGNVVRHKRPKILRDSDITAPTVPRVHVVPEKRGDVKSLIVKNNNIEKVTTPSVPVQYVRSPLTLEMVAIVDLAEHMRINLIDPRWNDQRKSMIKKINQTAKASDEEIAFNILNLAKHRPDMFGLLGDEIMKEKNTVFKNTSRKNTIIKTQKVTVSPKKTNTSSPSSLHSKKENDVTESETTFLLKYPGPRMIHVQYTNESSTEKSFSKTLNVQVQSLKVSIRVLRGWICEIIGLDSQNLKISAPIIGFLPDEKTLASLNIRPNSVLQLVVKE